MDAVAYQMSFDKEQLALLCANYDRRIDSLGVENKRLKAENAKLLELFNETLIRLAAASEAAGGGFMDARYCELLKNHGIEVDE